ncbi:putative secreted protein with PEP-CTERM sorting signal/MYXO-CTERM domain-containing protein [Nitrosospira sp. Nsp5]|uniref:PEP-CTERM protein-sorting domain-containing protein/MYXO-CTERM domain-containing protein n=1 Tax=Nitrosospira multiformis TaxID=1231 RepID=A0ABY0T7V4_9PROT|nr:MULTISPECIES: PEP-CTERM sorting domain-containing protein [Nitrosospira]PTR07454.1 putative secreted protein with PEP-CTERM sorting signal/MYXO-CTERM domain-containing protein [Nitrosospira sp. Nsp5]SDQ40645.1 PEP-CTERM protein-sorting domain-containing protein/MYXO-CTERM domain-containing protein [Nitrosospira multiformis]
MKMNFKLKALAVAAIMAASAPAFAAIDGGVTGNGELLLNVRYYGGDSATTGGDDISALFDLGLKMNDALAANSSLTGLTGTWNLNSGAYGASWNQLVSFVGAANVGQIEFNVIALDDTDRNIGGGSRYLTTGSVDAWPSQGNTNVKAFNGMDSYVNANNSRGTHATDANGASVAMPTDAVSTFFGAIGSGVPSQGDNWLTKTSVDTTQVLGSEQNFWFLTTSSASNLAQATKTPFGVDLNHDGVIGAGEFTKITLSDAGILSITSPVPEADTWAMLLAGLGMLGAMVRRRTGA